MVFILKISLCLLMFGTYVIGRKTEKQLICGGATFYPDSYFCCNEYRFDRHSYTEDSCCGGIIYNSLTQLCCDSNLYARNESYLECCGKTVFNSDTHMCCGGVISKKGCSLACCGGRFYYTNTHECCRDVVFRIQPGLECCGASFFNTSTDICCNGCIQRRGRGRKCCGKNLVYNTSTQSCCYGTSEVYNPQTHICCGTVQPRKFGINTRCCHGDKGVLYDHRTSRCCDGRVVGNVGGGHLPSNTACCSNLLYVPDSYTKCCGPVLYNPMTHVCCSSHRRDGESLTSVNLKQRNHECCMTVYYDTTKASCCCNEVVYTNGLRNPFCCDGQLFEGPGACCENRWFKGNSLHCCGPNVVHPGHRCCDHKMGTTFDPKRAACCNNKIVKASPLPANQTDTYSCCGSTPYIRSKFLCCCDCLHRRVNVTSCCGKKPYNYKSHFCCYKRKDIIPRGRFNNCRGSIIPYNTETHRCCPVSRVVPKNQSCDQ